MQPGPISKFFKERAMPKIQVFSSAEPAFLVNSFIIETGHGLVLVDTQFLTSTARQLCDAIRARAKPLLAVVITHPHPDHFNGTAEIDREWPGLPIYATQTTIDVIRATEAGKRATWTPVYGDDYPKKTVLPNTVVQPGEAIVVDGLELRIDDLGEGESADISVVYLPQSRELIASDLLYHCTHPWLAEGRTREWLDQIDVVRARYADAAMVYAGHGPAGNLDALSKQAEYLSHFRDLVHNEVAELLRPTPEEKGRIARDMRNRYPNYPLEMLFDMNIEGVAKEIAAELSLVQ
jgi:glyoxylase-like metal-dependent hydrolase (beta-lactamase superfamily II)